jgi:hypothetical protein
VDSEVSSLDVNVDSNDARCDSDSNQMNNYDSSQEDPLETNGNHKSLDDSVDLNSTPRTRSRGTVKIDLWTLDDSPIMPPKRKLSDTPKTKKKTTSENNADATNDSSIENEPHQVCKKESNLKELKIMVTKMKMKSPTKTPSPKSKAKNKKSLLKSANLNRTLDSWVSRSPRATTTATSETTPTRNTRTSTVKKTVENGDL